MTVALTTGGGVTSAVAYGHDSQNVDFCCTYGDTGVTTPTSVTVHGCDDQDTFDHIAISLSTISVVYGYGGDDEIYGSSSTSGDRLYGGGGNDLIYGYGGPDDIDGGEGWDEIYGGNGDDRICGGTSGDQLYGEADNDSLYGGYGDDDFTIDGGTGASDKCEHDSDVNCDSYLASYTCPF
jgi:Ca2+-binding RTX toxin-like protein